MINTAMDNNAGTAVMMENSADTSTAQNEAVEQLSAKMHVTMDEAKVALNAANWNMLTATHLLEQEAFRRKQEMSEIINFSERAAATDAVDDDQAVTESQTVADSDTVSNGQAEDGRKGQKTAQSKAGENAKKLGHTIMDLIRHGNRNRFVIRRDGEQLLDMPVTILVLLLLGSFGTCAFLMVLGLFFGCRYTISESSIGAAEA